jgi:hypothetical protein
VLLRAAARHSCPEAGLFPFDLLFYVEHLDKAETETPVDLRSCSRRVARVVRFPALGRPWGAIDRGWVERCVEWI